MAWCSVVPGPTTRPYHPQTCGEVERFPSDPEEVAGRPARRRHHHRSAASAGRLPRLLQPRPAAPRLGRRTPAEAYAARRRLPGRAFRWVEDHGPVRHDERDTNGELTLRFNSRLHDTGLGRRYAGTPVLVLVHDLHIRVPGTSGGVLRDLIPDPTRDHQPHAR